MRTTLGSLGLWMGLLAAPLAAADWSQWRGDRRDGVAADSPPLIEALPAGGLQPRWISEPVPSGNDGGWGSPIVAGGRVYLFSHTRKQTAEGTLAERKYPWLPPDKRGHLTAEQYEEYEVHRRAEDFERGKQFGYRETIHCLEAETGKTVWKNEQPSVYTRFLHSGSPTLVDGRIYILAAGRRARCIDAATGADLWNTPLPGEFHDEYFMSCFAVVDGVAVVLAGYLAGVDAQTGEVLWTGDEKATRGTHSSPVIWNDGKQSFVIANVAGNQTVALEPKTGKIVWQIESEAGLSTPVVAGNRLVTLGNSRRAGLRCFELTATEAKPLWVYNGLGDKGSSPVVVGDYVYAQGEKRLACVSLETGKAAWTASLDLANPQYTSLIAVDGKVFYAYDGLLCFAADPEQFRPLVDAKFNKSGRIATEAALRQELQLDALEKEPGGLEKSTRLYQQEIGSQGPLPCSSPAVADGRLYLRLRQGIACYDLSDSSR